MTILPLEPNIQHIELKDEMIQETKEPPKNEHFPKNNTIYLKILNEIMGWIEYEYVK